jgi:hypothetical protein
MISFPIRIGSRLMSNKVASIFTVSTSDRDGAYAPSLLDVDSPRTDNSVDKLISCLTDNTDLLRYRCG